MLVKKETRSYNKHEEEVTMKEMIGNYVISIKSTSVFCSGNNFYLYYVLDGVLNCQIMDKNEIIETGQMFFINRYEVSTLFSEQGCIVQVICIDSERAVKYFPEMENIFFGCATLRYADQSDEFNYGRDKIFLSDCINHFYEEPSQELTEQGRFILSLLCLEYDSMNDRNGIYSFISYDKKQRMKRIFHYIEENYQEKITLQEVAESEQITPQYLTSVWKECFSTSFMNYVMNLRLKSVERKLLFSEKPIQDIIYESGFQDTKSFYTYFRKCFKKSPTDWKKMMKSRSDDWKVLSFEESVYYLEKMREEKNLFNKPMDSMLYHKYLQIHSFQNKEKDLRDFKIVVYPYDTYKLDDTKVTPLFMFGYDLLMREVYNRSLKLSLVVDMNSFNAENLAELVSIQEYIFQSILRFGKISLSRWSIELKCENANDLHLATEIQKMMAEKGVLNIDILL